MYDLFYSLTINEIYLRNQQFSCNMIDDDNPNLNLCCKVTEYIEPSASSVFNSSKYIFDAKNIVITLQNL